MVIQRHLGKEKATATLIAAINVDVMTTVTVTTVGASWGCPRTKEQQAVATEGSMEGRCDERDLWEKHDTIILGAL